MNYVTKIKNYILFLKTKCRLLVTIHSVCSDLLLKDELIAFNIHESLYCLSVKSCKDAQEHCSKKQKKIAEKCVGGSFCGVCWAGVKEYVYPVKFNENVVGFICVSGYKCENPNEYVFAAAKKFGLPQNKLLSAYQSLNNDMPEKSYVDALIYPLCDMFELAHIKAENNDFSNNSFIGNVVQYIKKNYTAEISSETICKKFGCSRASLSKKFNAELKTSLPEYITKLRIEAAKTLLSYSQSEISDIALSVGFNEPYYFSMIFKKLVGITPSEYRKRI